VEHLPPSGKPHPLTRDSDFRPTRNVRKTAIGSFRGSAAGREPAIHNHRSRSMDSGARLRVATAPPHDARPAGRSSWHNSALYVAPSPYSPPALFATAEPTLRDLQGA